MKNLISLVVSFAIVNVSYSQDIGTEIRNSLLATQIEYRVTSDKPDVKMHISYTDEKGQPFAIHGLSGWTLSFTTDKNPYTAILQVTNISTTLKKMKISLEILVNGKVVVSKKGEIGTKASSDQIIQYIIRD